LKQGFWFPVYRDVATGRKLHVFLIALVATVLNSTRGRGKNSNVLHIIFSRRKKMIKENTVARYKRVIVPTEVKPVLYKAKQNFLLLCHQSCMEEESH
jgi:hypothetical protein